MMEPSVLSPDGAVRNYSNGEWVGVDASDGRSLENPATGEKLSYVPFTDEAGVDQVVADANEAFEEWRKTPVEERIQPLFRLKMLLEEHQEDLAEILVREHGKTKGEASGEIRRGIENVETACGIPSLMQGGTLENAAPDIDESAIREPLGVFAAVTPFNFPGMIPLWFLPHAVATGNCFILKPSEQTPLTAQYIFELVDEAGFPDGVVNLVNGGPDTVNTILAHDGIAGVSFVGSTPVAKHVYETAAKHGKRVQAQGGAKNYVYVSDTANLDYAASQVLSAACACAGERCLALDMAVVDESVYDEFADLIVEKADDMNVTDGLDPETNMGALISDAHRDRVLGHIETGVEEGATLLRDGREDEVTQREPGNFLGPSVFGDVTSEMTIAQEEIFGPVVGLMKASGIEDGIDIVNGSEFGNAASIFTDSGHEARLFRRDVVSGNIGVNVGTVAPMAFFHFGGRKASFFGDLHAQAKDAVQFYTDETVYIERWPDQRE